MSCPDELTLSIASDGELPAEEMHRVVDHLQTCDGCRALLVALEQENAVLRKALAEEEVVAVVRTSRPIASAASWIWGAIAAAAAAPLLLDWVWQGTPSLPVGLRWIGSLGGWSGLYSLSGGLLSLIVGGQDMLVSSFGFVATLFIVIGTLGVVTLRQHPLAGAGLALALLGAIAPTTHARAAEFRYEEEGTVKVDADESIDDTVFLGGRKAIVAGVVDGDVFAAAEHVEVTGTVRGNLYSGGESVTIAGEVGGNVHAAGKTVEFDTRVGGSGFLAGQSVLLTERSEIVRGAFVAGESVRSKGRVGRGLYFAAESMDLSGEVERDMRGYGNRVSVSSTGSVGGDLQLTVPSLEAVQIDDGATITGATEIEIEEKKERRAFLYPGFYFGVVAKAIAMLVIGLLLVTLFPALRPPAPESSNEVLRDMGIGFLALLATPVAILFIALTVIGIPVSLVLAMLYAMLVFLSTLVVAYFLAERLPLLQQSSVLLRTGLSLLVILFLVEIPFIGAGLSFLIHIFGMGCLLMHFRNLYLQRKGPTSAPPLDPSVALAP